MKREDGQEIIFCYRDGVVVYKDEEKMRSLLENQKLSLQRVTRETQKTEHGDTSLMQSGT